VYTASEYCNVFTIMCPIKALTVALCMIVTQIQLSIAIADDPMISLDAITRLLRLEPCQCVLC